MNKMQLAFNTDDAQSILDSDNVGAYLRSADGTLLTHTDVGGKKALDVRIAEGINVEVDLDAADDSVASWTNDGAGNPIGSTGGALHISDAGGSLTVDAVDLDIRDLVAATDSVSSWTKDGAGTSITSTLVSGKQGLDVNIVNSTLTVSDAALANTAVQSRANDLAVADTAQVAVVTPLANRKYLFLRNYTNKEMYIGGADVDADNGWPIGPGGYMELRAGVAAPVNFIGRTGETPEIRTLELS